MSDTELDFNLFEEPEDFRPPPPAANFITYDRVLAGAQPAQIPLRLVGTSPLWGHLLWNAGKYTANYIDEHVELSKGKRVLELGAAAALPSLMCGLNGAAKVVCTDYPDPDLIANIQYNVDHCEGLPADRVVVKGYIWGNDTAELVAEVEGGKFDLIILSDLVFNHTEHLKLLQTCKDCLAADGKLFVVFSPHRPWLLENDLAFFETAKEFGYRTEKNDLVVWKPMFEEDDETVEVRSRVYSFFLYPEGSDLVE